MEIDVRGLNCPQPLIKVKNYIEENSDSPFGVIYSNNDEGKASLENVGRFLKKFSRTFTVKTEEDIIIMYVDGKNLHKAPKSQDQTTDCKLNRHFSSLTAIIKSDSIGADEKELGRILMHSFLRTLPEIALTNNRVIFMNCGVKLTCGNSEFLSVLKELESKNFDIYVCGTCLDYFKLKSELKIGKISNMLEIMTLIKEADKTICLS